MSLILQLLILVGATALFLYGMKTMGEALQKLSGSKMRYLLRTMTNSPIKQVSVGALTSSIVQSSSATTVMVVSFVNAGLISLLQSIGMIMGANIGTTTTAWIIAIFGFKFEIGLIAIPLIGLGFPFLMSRYSRRRAWGNVIIGFAILFLATGFMGRALAVLGQCDVVGGILAAINGMALWSALIYFALGIALTLFVQSSSASIILTMVLCFQNIIPFELGAAMILGANVGSAINANVSSLVSNINARRVAIFHLIFNVFGAIIALAFLGPITRLISEIMSSAGGDSPFAVAHNTPIAIAMFHTLLNLFITVLLLPFRRPIVSILSKNIDETPRNGHPLQYIESGIYTTGALSLVQAQQALKKQACQASKMFDKVSEMFRESNQERFYDLFDQIEEQENEAIEEQSELNDFLASALRGDIGNEAKEHIRRLTKLSSDIEVMTEAILCVARVVKRRKDKSAWFTPELRDSVNEMFSLVDMSLEIMNGNIKALLSHTEPNIQRALEVEEKINHKRLEFRDIHHENEEGDEINLMSGIIFTDIISKSEQLADSIFRISKDACKAVNLYHSETKSNDRKTI